MQAEEVAVKRKAGRQAPMRATIKEELVVLTGDYVAALLLNQFLRWCNDTGEDGDCQESGQERWVHKSEFDIAHSLMTGVSGTAVRVCLHRLVFRGWLLVRRGAEPRPWQMEYRPDYERITADLKDLGYTLDVT
jgi:hypothetical protein